jgi:hypothetical protein
MGALQRGLQLSFPAQRRALGLRNAQHLVRVHEWPLIGVIDKSKHPVGRLRARSDTEQIVCTVGSVSDLLERFGWVASKRSQRSYTVLQRRTLLTKDSSG